MGRTVDQEVHAAFVEFRAKEDDKVGIHTVSVCNTSVADWPSLRRCSVCPSSASTASRSAQRTPAGRSSICSSVLPCAVTTRAMSRPLPQRLLPTALQPTAIRRPPRAPAPLPPLPRRSRSMARSCPTACPPIQGRCSRRRRLGASPAVRRCHRSRRRQRPRLPARPSPGALKAPQRCPSPGKVQPIFLLRLWMMSMPRSSSFAQKRRTSVCPSSAYTASRSAQKTPAGNASTSSSALPTSTS